MNTKPASRRGTLLRAAYFSVGCMVATVLCFTWSGCSPEKYYKQLSFFFDGVPNPEAIAKARAAGTLKEDIRKSKTYSVHKPFADDNCAACHSERYKLTNQDSSVCMQCHADRTTEYPKMHGPVAAVACLWCHSPHESAEAHLLKNEGRQVCLQCHESGMLSAERVAAHADVSRNCLDCHAAHGGTAAFFLRPGVTANTPPAAEARKITTPAPDEHKEPVPTIDPREPPK